MALLEGELRAMKSLAAAAAVIFLAACTPTTERIMLKHAETGKTVHCGPYRSDRYSTTAAAMKERGCIRDFQRQGYERMPAKE